VITFAGRQKDTVKQAPWNSTGLVLSAQLSEFDGNFPVREKATCGAFCINPASVIPAMILGRNPDSN